VRVRLPFVSGARRRRRARAGAPKTILPMPDKPLDPARIEAARERLRRDIPPRPAED
jgi:DNA-directed RNA polymerase subunit K/omega